MFFIPYGTREKTARKRFPYVNLFLVAVNVAVFAYETYLLAALGKASYEHFIARYAFVPASLAHAVFPLAIVTAMFLHSGLLHIAGNMIYLLPFGDNVEDRLGHVRYLSFYFICGITANLVYAAFNRHSALPLLGASGAIAGVLGGYLALNPIGSIVKGFFVIIVIPLRIQLPAFIFIGYWFIIQLFSSVASLGVNSSTTGGVAFIAHVGGFIVGFVLAPLMAIRNHSGQSSYEVFNNRNNL